MGWLKFIFASLVIFSLGAFLGVKVIDNNQSIFVTVDFNKFGSFTIGKQVDLTNLSSLHNVDKTLLISGLAKLDGQDRISAAIIELEKTGQAMFLPKQFKVVLHVTEDKSLPRLGAATCKGDSENSYHKIVTIFDNREDSLIERAIRVGVWNTVEEATCFNSEDIHVWVNPDTAKLLYRAGSDFDANSMEEMELLGRVSESCKLEGI